MVTQQEFQDSHWSDIREKIQQHNPQLTAIIDDCQQRYPVKLSVGTFPYGAYFVKNGKRISASSTADTEHTGSKRYDVPLSQSLAIVLEGCFEHFHQFQERIAPLSCLLPGDLIGLTTHRLFNRNYNTPLSAQITAGARSIFMLPKITDSASHKNIQRAFNLRVPTPKKLMHHWDVFRLLPPQEQQEHRWQAQCLLLPEAWLEPLNPAFQALQHYLLHAAQQKQEYWQHQYLWNLTFSRIQALRNLKPNPFLADTCKHLFAIGVGAVPGFTAALTEQLAPVQHIQNIYVEVYDLKYYAPVLMQPQCYRYQIQKNPVYYSLQLPTLLEFSPKSRSLSSTISDLREVKQIMNIYLSELNKAELGIENTLMHEFSRTAEFTFFHSETDMYGEIRSTQTILAEDDHFNLAHTAYADSRFSENSPFVRGCIRIATAQSQNS